MVGSSGSPAVRRTLGGGGPRLEQASYVTTDPHDTFEEIVRTSESNPTSSFLLCPLSGDALGLPQGLPQLSQPREQRAAAGSVPTDNRRVRHPPAGRCAPTLYSPESKDLHPTLCSRDFLRASTPSARTMGGPPDEVDRRGSKCAGRR